MIVGPIVAVIGVALILKGSGVARALNQMRAEKARRASFGSEARRDQLQEMYRSPQNQVLERTVVQVFGCMITVGGIGIFIQALTR